MLHVIRMFYVMRYMYEHNMYTQVCIYTYIYTHERLAHGVLLEVDLINT